MAAYDEDMADTPAPRVRSTITRKQKGRGFREDAGEREDMVVERQGAYERDRASGPGPAKCEPLALPHLAAGVQAHCLGCTSSWAWRKLRSWPKLM